MSDLPEGWIETTIGDVTTKTEQRVPLQNDEFFYIDISSVDRSTKRIANPQKITGDKAPSRARQVVKSGDVLVSMTRPNLNAVAMVPNELNGQIASTGFDILRPKNLDPRWLYYLVRTDEFVNTMSDMVQGALYPAVRPRDIRGYPIPLAPLPEQKRIADKLDHLLARVDACQAHLGRVPEILKRFRQSTLTAAVSGRLLKGETKRKIGALPKGWKWVTIDEISQPERPVTYGILKPGDYFPDGVPMLRIVDINIGAPDLRTVHKVSHELSNQYRKTILQGGECLISLVGTIGLTTYVSDKLKGSNVHRNLGVIAPSDQIHGLYLDYCLKSEIAQKQIREFTTGANQPLFNIRDLKRVRIPLPPLAEQYEIIRRVNALFILADHVEAKWKAARERIGQLTPSILAKAFRGELVEQDSNDEPAIKLRERIRDAKETVRKKPIEKNYRPKAEARMLKKIDLKDNHLSFILKERGALTAEALWSASQLDIDVFYDQLKDEEAKKLLREVRETDPNAPRILEAL